MLSKKQARAFFLGGTLVTFLIFIGLTVYSFSVENDQTNHENITEAVVRGKKYGNPIIVWVVIPFSVKGRITHLSLPR